jgi:hypothetical protein
LGVFSGQCVEGTVGEKHLLAMRARFESVCLEYTQDRVGRGFVVLGRARVVSKLFAELAGASIEDCAHWLGGLVGFLDRRREQVPGQVVAAFWQ